MATKKRNLKQLFTDHKAAWIAGCCGIIATIGAQMVAGYFKSSPLPSKVISGTNINQAVLISGIQNGNNTIDDHSQKALQSISVAGVNYGIISPTQINNFGVDSNIVNKISNSINGLDDKTTDIETLTDGRTVIGGAIVTTKPRVILKKANAGSESFIKGDYATAFNRFQEVVNYFENPPSPEAEGYALQIGQNYFPDRTKAYCYGMAAQSALAMGSNSIALSYAEKAVKTDSAARNFLILSSCETGFGLECLKNKNYEKGLAHSIKGVEAYEAARTANNYLVGYMVITNTSGVREVKVGGEVEMMPARAVSRLYYISGLAALAQQSNSLALEYAQKAVNADPSCASAGNLVQKLKSVIN